MLKLLVMFMCCLCYPRPVWDAPVIKASGVQWTEPKGNGKGNLTLIMIPQNNSCGNDTDMLIAVKSDYQVMSQDTQLLNLVINEYRNDSSKCDENQAGKMNSPNLNGKENRYELNLEKSSGINSNNVNELNHPLWTDNNALNKLTNDKVEVVDGHQKNVFGLDLSNCSMRAESCVTAVPELNKNYKSGINQESMKQNHPSEVDTKGNRFNQLETSNDISKERNIYQADDLNKKGDKNLVKFQQNSKADSLTYQDLVRYLHSVGEEDQHLEVGSGKGSYRANYYESEKKHFKENQLTSTTKELINGSEINIFKFLKAAQASNPTASVTEIPDVFKFLRVTEPSLLEAHNSQGVSRTENKSVTSSITVNSKYPRSNIFNESEIKVFKFLNLTEPIQVNKGREDSISDFSKNLGSFKNILSEKVNHVSMIKKIKPEQTKETNLRSDQLPDNQVAELVALDEGEFDSKAKKLNDDSSASASDETIFKKQLMNLLNSHYIGESISDESGNHESDIASTKVCVTNSNNDKYLINTPVNPLGGRENTASVLYGGAGDTTDKVTGNADKDTISMNVQTPLVTSLGAIENTATAVQSEDQVTTASPTCKTSIIYICDSQKVMGTMNELITKVEEKVIAKTDNQITTPQPAMQESLQKITLTPQIDCVSKLKSKQISATIVPNSQPGQEDHSAVKSVFPLIESAMLLANNNEISKGKSIPILLNSSSDSVGDVLLTRRDDKLASLHGNPSDLSMNEDILVDIPPKIDTVRNNVKKIIPLKTSNSRNGDQEFHPFQVLKVRVAGKNLIVEQMPYRSEKFNKNCNSTPSGEPPSDELEPDGDENQVSPSKESSTIQKPPIKGMSTKERSESTNTYIDVTTQIASDQPGKISKTKEKDYTKSKSFTSTSIPTQSEKELLEEKETPIKESLETESTSEQPEYSQVSTEATNKIDKISSTEKEGLIQGTTECITENIITSTASEQKQINQEKDTTIKRMTKKTSVVFEDDISTSHSVAQGMNEVTEINEPLTYSNFNPKLTTTRKPLTSFNSKPIVNDKEDKTLTPQLELDISTCDSCITLWNNKEFKSADTPTTTKKTAKKPTTKIFGNHYNLQTSSVRTTELDDFPVNDEPQMSTPFQLPKEEQKCDQNVNIPAGSVKEIVIKIVRNTRKPRKYKTKCNYQEDNSVQSKFLLNNCKIPTLRKMCKEEIKPGGFEIEMSNTESDGKQNINYRHQKQMEDEKNIEGDFKKYNMNPYFSNGNFFDDFYVGKDSNENSIESPQSDKIKLPTFKQSEKYDKDLSFNGLKLSDQNVINIT